MGRSALVDTVNSFLYVETWIFAIFEKLTAPFTFFISLSLTLTLSVSHTIFLCRWLLRPALVKGGKPDQNWFLAKATQNPDSAAKGLRQAAIVVPRDVCGEVSCRKHGANTHSKHARRGNTRMLHDPAGALRACAPHRKLFIFYFYCGKYNMLLWPDIVLTSSVLSPGGTHLGQSTIVRRKLERRLMRN